MITWAVLIFVNVCFWVWVVALVVAFVIDLFDNAPRAGDRRYGY